MWKFTGGATLQPLIYNQAIVEESETRQQNEHLYNRKHWES